MSSSPWAAKKIRTSHHLLSCQDKLTMQRYRKCFDILENKSLPLTSLNLVRTIVPNRAFLLKLNRMANSEDPDKTAHYEPSYQDLHCLQV